jgi:uncharacterized OB-fold protein
MVDVDLPTRGFLWSWTIQGFEPKSPPFRAPGPFTPYGVGYVELPGALRVESRLTEADPDRLRIGMEMELVFEPFGMDVAGNELVTFAFAPAAS